MDVTAMLRDNILAFWINRMQDKANGGFYGEMNGNGVIQPGALKGGILHARILWSFSAAYRTMKSPEYLEVATATYNYILRYFFDPEHGGTYWSLYPCGKPAETKKQIYSQAFFVYALSEYHLATGSAAALYKAGQLFDLIELHSFDTAHNGYSEAFTREWKPLADVRLSDKDANENKTMNTHLHILEAYTHLLRAYNSIQAVDANLLRNKLSNLTELFLNKIIHPATSHLDLFFNDEWTCKSTAYSYGHDIEASWLLCEAAEALGNHLLTERVHAVSIAIAEAVAAEGVLADGSLASDHNYATGQTNTYREWWQQAEGVAGFARAAALTHKESFERISQDMMQFILTHLVDNPKGEWYWGVNPFPDETPDRSRPKAGFWKCPYHNTRMCLIYLKERGTTKFPAL